MVKVIYKMGKFTLHAVPETKAELHDLILGCKLMGYPFWVEPLLFGGAA